MSVNNEELVRIIEGWGRLFEPATGTRGQGGLPVTGTVTDWELTMTKDGWRFHKDALITALQTLLKKQDIESRIDQMTEDLGIDHASIKANREELIKLQEAKGNE